MSAPRLIVTPLHLEVALRFARAKDGMYLPPHDAPDMRGAADDLVTVGMIEAVTMPGRYGYQASPGLRIWIDRLLAVQPPRLHTEWRFPDEPSIHRVLPVGSSTAPSGVTIVEL